MFAVRREARASVAHQAILPVASSQPDRLELLRSAKLKTSFQNRSLHSSVTWVSQTGDGEAVDIYIAELDENSRVAAVWLKQKMARGTIVFDPKKHVFDPRASNEFCGAPREDIVKWLGSAQN